MYQKPPVSSSQKEGSPSRSAKTRQQSTSEVSHEDRTGGWDAITQSPLRGVAPATSVWFGGGLGSVWAAPMVQAKLEVSAPDDVFEKEADAVADRVVGELQQPAIPAEKSPLTVSRLVSPAAMQPVAQAKCDTCAQMQEEEPQEEASDQIQRKALAADAGGEDTPPNDSSQRKPGLVQRKCEACQQAEEEQMVQTKRDQGYGPMVPMLQSQLQATRGQGMPLTPRVRAQMERSFGADFGQVRIHTGAYAADMARGLHA